MRGRRVSRQGSSGAAADTQRTTSPGKSSAVIQRYSGVPAPGQTPGEPSGAGAQEGEAGAGAEHETTATDEATAKPDQPTAKGARRAGAPRTKGQALARHAKNQRLMRKIIASGLSLQPDPTLGAGSRQNLYKNSAEWIDQGEAKMLVLSPTHDSEKRDSVVASETAYFDTRVDYKGSGANYDARLTGGKATNDAGIRSEISSVVGTMSGDGKTLTMIDPQKNDEGFVVETLIHETQHDADQHKKGDPWAVVPGASTSPEPAKASRYNSFQSEFRAYWMENPEGSPGDQWGSSTKPATNSYTIKAIRSWGADKAKGGGDDTVDTATLTPSNERQENILLHMGMTSRPNGDWYDYTPGAERWNTSYGYVFYYYAVDPTFKAMVDSYTTPVGGNFINSVRVQKLSEAIETGDWLKIVPAVVALDALDLQFLNDRTGSKSFWDRAAAKLGLFGFPLFEAMISKPPMGPYQNLYTTVKGDTLWGIAERILYDGTRWREIYQPNKATIGNDPNKLKVGLKLVLPPV